MVTKYFSRQFPVTQTGMDRSLSYSTIILVWSLFYTLGCFELLSQKWHCCSSCYHLNVFLINFCSKNSNGEDLFQRPMTD